ncbi:DUF6918 family protein [Corynebacterium sp.]|uniref:DUF6918 family protein n=1 Tax=Corynebacterium sp. TaxID=1720 RepID=UPI003736E2E9
MSDLSQLLTDDKRPAVVDDLASHAEQVISEQSGVTGMAVKGGAAAAKKFDSDIFTKAVNRVLPDVLGEFQPYWQEFQDSSSDDFGAFVSVRSAEVADSLLGVADQHASKVDNSALAKIYDSVRGRATKIIEPAVPGLATALQRHMA